MDRIMAAHPTIPVENSQLAATAMQYRLTFATRNVRHFVRRGSLPSIRSDTSCGIDGARQFLGLCMLGVED
jgi:hypothetical protein